MSVIGGVGGVGQPRHEGRTPISTNGVSNGLLGGLVLPVRAPAPVLTWQMEGVPEGVPCEAKPGVGANQLAAATLQAMMVVALVTDAR